jgi:hypothetical protein
MKIKATYLLYPNAVRVSSTYGAFDSDGNKIEVDEAAVAAKVAELEVEYQWKELRQQRNRLIAETDYLALSDSTLTTEMAAYRQALRDLPANTTDPTNPVWPVKPGGAS